MSTPLPKPSEGGPRPRIAVDRRSLQPYIRVQRAMDHDVLRALKETLTRISADLRGLRGDSLSALVRIDQLNAAKEAVYRDLASFWRSMGDLTQAYRYEAAAAGIESIGIHDRLLFRGTGVNYKSLQLGLEQYAKNAIDVGTARLSTSRITLSTNVYRAEALSTGQIDDTVNALLHRGTSAREIAEAVEAFVDPDVPGGVSYAAMRLGRTELNNAFHAAQAETMAVEPWVNATQWNLSGSHPKPDACDDYAADTRYNGEAGQYSTASVPANPHPFCLCFLTPVLDTAAAFLNRLNSGEFDDAITRLSA